MPGVDLVRISERAVHHGHDIEVAAPERGLVLTVIGDPSTGSPARIPAVDRFPPGQGSHRSQDLGASRRRRRGLPGTGRSRRVSVPTRSRPSRAGRTPPGRLSVACSGASGPRPPTGPRRGLVTRFTNHDLRNGPMRRRRYYDRRRQKIDHRSAATLDQRQSPASPLSPSAGRAKSALRSRGHEPAGAHRSAETPPSTPQGINE